jgi:CHASE3 domain sensor protein
MNGKDKKITWQQRANGGNSNERIELMAALTLDRVLTDAEALPVDEREMLESLLRRRRIETWRQETAAEARKAIKAFRSGKLKSQSAEKLIASLRKSK